MASKRGKRTLIDPNVPGCYRDDLGTCVNVWHGGRNHERRFPPDTSLKKLQQLRACLLADVVGKSSTPILPSTRRHARDKAGKIVEVAQVGPTLRAAGDAYLRTVPAVGTKKAGQQADLDAWCTILGDETLLTALTRGAVQVAAVPWDEQYRRKRPGFSGSTLIKRRHTLRCILRHAGVLDVTQDLPKWKEPKLQARGLSRTVVRYIFQSLPAHSTRVGGGPNLSRLRLAVMALTGFPQAIVKLLEPRHVDYKAGKVWMPGRDKGEGSDPRSVPVTPEALDVLRAFFAAGASGPFNTDMLAWTFHRAVAKARVAYEADEHLTWPAPADLRPYDLRHCYGTDYYEATGDIVATGYVLGHAPGSRMTVRYVQAAVDKVAAKGRDLLASTAGAPLIPSAPDLGTRGNVRKFRR